MVDCTADMYDDVSPYTTMRWADRVNEAKTKTRHLTGGLFCAFNIVEYATFQSQYHIEI